MRRRHVMLGAMSALALAVGGIAPPASASTRHAGTEHFLVLQTDEEGTQFVIGNGPVHAAGTDVQVNDQRDRFIFPKGALLFWHLAQGSHDSFDPVTCLETETEHGIWKVTGGTDQYSHARGHGTYRGQVFVQGGCAPGEPRHIWSVTVHADGHLSY